MSPRTRTMNNHFMYDYKFKFLCMIVYVIRMHSYNILGVVREKIPVVMMADLIAAGLQLG